MTQENIDRWRGIAEMTKLPQTVFVHAAADLGMTYYTSRAAVLVDKRSLAQQASHDNGQPVLTVLPLKWFA